MKYRKRPVIVEAEQWYPGKPVVGVTIVHDGGKADDGSTLPCHAFVVTVHGQRTTVSPGDWIITEPDGVHHYPCKPDIFMASYEPFP